MNQVHQEQQEHPETAKAQVQQELQVQVKLGVQQELQEKVKQVELPAQVEIV